MLLPSISHYSDSFLRYHNCCLSPLHISFLPPSILTVLEESLTRHEEVSNLTDIPRITEHQLLINPPQKEQFKNVLQCDG
uniref:Uncharacterized protein n=1 Tax=Anguilla anguilla TaxID=7936 RepID=A0A0E9X179_ANGAN